MLKGIDLSHWNTFEEALITQPDTKFAILKASEGATFVDPAFASHIKKAKERGLLLGAYHFARPENNTPEEEAAHFIDTCEKNGLKFGTFVPVLDYEGMSHTVGEQWALEWLNTVYGITGVKPMIYLSQSYVKHYAKVCSGDYGLWVSRYRDFKDGAGDVSPWKQEAVWQYSGTTPVDLDVFYGNEEQWQKYCNVDKMASCNCGCDCCKG